MIKGHTGLVKPTELETGSWVSRWFAVSVENGKKTEPTGDSFDKAWK